MTLVATSSDGPASSSFNSLDETDTIDWYIFSTKFPKQFDSETGKFKAQAAAQKIKPATQSISIYVCRVEDLVNRGWHEID